jgi:hypothetical protein
MKPKGLIKLLLFSFLSILSSCNKEPCDESAVANLILTESDRKINPYSGNEVLVFKNMNNDSFEMNLGAKKSGTHVQYRYAQDYADQYHDGCQGNYFTSDYEYFSVRSSNDSNLIMINLGNSYSFDYPTSNKKVFLFFDTKDSKGWCFAGTFNFSNDSLIDNPKNNYDSIVAFHDQIVIGPKSFKNIFELYTPCPSPRCTEWFCTAYYSITDGFVGLRSNFGKIWYLDEKM